jgi:heptosyltransferase-2
MMKKRKFLIARIDRIGDTILATPLARELKKSFPGCEVTVLVRSYTRNIFLNNPHVDEILVWDDFSRGIGKIFKLAKFLRHHKFTDGFMLLPNETLAYSFLLAGIKNRYGSSRKPYHILTGTKSLDRKKYGEDRSEADYCLDFVRVVGGTVEMRDTEVFLTEEEKQTAQEIKRRIAPNGEKIIGVHITSGGSAPNLLPSEYIRLIELLLKQPNTKVVVTDNALPQGVTLPDGVSVINSDKSKRDFLNFTIFDLFISSSTGTMHLAGALKVDTLSVFCPLPACKPALWGPVGNNAKFILPEAEYCKNNCPGEPKKCKFVGPGGIDAERVQVTSNN